MLFRRHVIGLGFFWHRRYFNRQGEINLIDHLNRLFSRKNIAGRRSVHHLILGY